jgi:hypothetical protein
LSGEVKDISANIDWKRLQTLVLQYMNANAAKMTKDQLNMPMYIQDPDTMEEIPLTYPEQIKEIQALSDIGKKLISMKIHLLAQLHPTAT